MSTDSSEQMTYNLYTTKLMAIQKKHMPHNE